MVRKRRVQKKLPQAKASSGQNKWTRAYYILGIFIAVVTVGGLIAVAADRSYTTPAAPAAAQPGASVPSLGNDVIDDPNAKGVQYNSAPPTSGPHFSGGPAAWGVHTEPVPKAQMVSNLEIGGVVVSYDPQLPKEVVDKLARIVGGYPEKVLMAPYPGLDAKIALTAWTRILKLDSFDEPSITAFIDAYRGIDHTTKKP